MLFNQYPYLNLNDLNLDYLLKTLRDLSVRLENFIALNTIKYANPIQWNITKQYEANTVVIDANDGTAYLSIKPVPSGVALTNTDYWTPIFTLNLLSANQNITLRDDGANVLATFASVAGDWLIWNNTLYRVTQAINTNEAYVVGYNLERFSVELFIKEYINNVVAMIGDLNDLTTTDKDNVVDAINELVTTANAINVNIGDLSDLTTSDKTSIVNAINEVINKIKPNYVFANVSEMTASTYDFAAGEVIYLTNTHSSWVVRDNSVSPYVQKTLTNSKYAVYMPHNEFDMDALELAANTDLYPYLNYYLYNGYTSILLPSGNYSLSETLIVDYGDTMTPLIKLQGHGRYKTKINTTKGFIEIRVSGYEFRGSVISGFHAQGVKTGPRVGGAYRGIQILSKNNSGQDMADSITISDIELTYYNTGLYVACRMIWNLFKDLLIHYCNVGMYLSASDTAAMNVNTFINCQFDTNGGAGVYFTSTITYYACANAFIGCSIEGNNTDATTGNFVEALLSNVIANFISCHFEKGDQTNPTARAIYLLGKSNVIMDGCTFIYYPNYLYTVETDSQLVINSPSLNQSATANYAGIAATINNAFTI